VPFVLLFPVAVSANAIRTWRRRAAATQERIRYLEQRQEEETQRAVELERARIARELHDVVTHNVSVMIVQAGAARKVMDATPQQAEQALLAVEASGRAAMAELRQVMGLLNGDAGVPAGPGQDQGQSQGGSETDLAPQPDLERLDALVGRVRDSGTPVTLTVTGQPRPVPPGIGLAAYRVVQEALTNTVKHAAGASASVTVEYAKDALRLEVADTGGGPGQYAVAGNGRGLVGLRERLAVYGGSLEAGRRPAGGYRVRALIPLDPEDEVPFRAGLSNTGPATVGEAR
jgi:signal transduction histidine kinase